MAARLQDDFYSKDGDKYTVIIDDADWVGAVTEFNCTELIVNYNRKSSEKYNPIITSDLALSVLIENSTLETFLTALIGSREERFIVKLNKNDSIYWVGIIKTDSVYIEDLPKPYNLKITATDGIGRLRDIDYNDDGADYTGKETFIDHIFNILDKIGLDSFWGTSDTYFSDLVDWWETTQTKAAATDPFDSARFNHKAFINVDKKGEKIYTSCYDVLKAICEQWAARFMLSDGAYRINQINYYDDATVTVIRNYTKTKGFSSVGSSSLVLWDKEMGTDVEFKNGEKDLFKVTSGGFSFYPPLSSVEVLYNHYSMRNVAAWQDITSTTTVNDIDSTNGTARVAFQANLTYSAAIALEEDYYTHYIMFKLKIKIGSYYLSRPLTINDDLVIIGDMEWTTNNTDRYYFVVREDDYDEIEERTLGFISPAIIEDGDMETRFQYHFSHDGENWIDDGYFTLNWTLSSVYLEVLQEGTIADQYNITKFKSRNNTTGNTAKIKKKGTTWRWPIHDDVRKYSSNG